MAAVENAPGGHVVEDGSAGGSLAYTATELAAALGLHVATVYRHADAGQIPCKRIGGRRVFPKAAIDRWLNAT